jgi:hypothetical protein
MTESSPADAWYMGRLAPMLNFGWSETDLIAFLLQDQHRIHHRLEWLEGTFQRAERLQERLERLTTVLDIDDEQTREVQECLNDPMIVPDARSLMDQWSASLAPWEPALEAAKPTWEAAGEGETWLRLFHALFALDESSHGAVALIQPLFATPERTDALWEHVNHMTQDERRQRDVLKATAEGLRDIGHDVPDLEQATLMEALDCVEAWQALHHAVEDAIVEARRLIGPFDKDEAERRIAELRSVDRPEGMERLTERRADVVKTGQRLEERRKDLSESLNIWRREGFVFPISEDLRPEELYDWETNFESISETVDRHRALRIELERFQRLWPTKTRDLEDVMGHLDQTDELEQRLEALQQEWKRLELDGLAVLEPYRQAGMHMDEWMQRLMEEPRSTLERMLHERTIWDEQKHLIDRYDALDVSAGGRDDQQVRLEILRRPSLAPEVVDELRANVELKERRQRRHRTMLEDALGRLRIVRGQLEERSTDGLSLAGFEAHVTALERGEGGSNVGPFAERAVVGLRDEVERLRNAGWNTMAWERLLDEDPRTVAIELNRARPHVREAERLMRRIEALPWHRDVDLALHVQQQARQPEALVRLAQRIPAWLTHLSQRPEDGTEFVLNLWTPPPVTAQPPSSEGTTEHGLTEAHQERPRPVPEASPMSEETHMMEPVHASHAVSNDAVGPIEGGAAKADEQIEGVGPRFNTRNRHLEPKHEVRAESAHLGTVVAQHEDDMAASSDGESTDEPTVTAMDPPRTDGAGRVHITPRDALPGTMSEPVAGPSNTGEGTQSALSALEGLLSMLGLEQAAVAIGSRGMDALNDVRRSVAQHVNLQPRDIRVARLLRLMLRLLPAGDEQDERRGELLTELRGALPSLQRWTRRRLEARHSGATGDFLQDALALGQALHRIPGLGRPVPLEADRWPLPTHMGDLATEVKRWARTAQPPAAGGVRG